MNFLLNTGSVEEFNDPSLSQLASRLQVFSDTMNIPGLDTQSTLENMKAHIKIHIQKHTEEGFPKENIKSQLDHLVMNGLIPSDIMDWCYEEMDTINEDCDQKKCTKIESEDVPEVPAPLPPLVTKDTVYHASLCSYALSTNDSRDDFLSYHKHSFNELSISVDRDMLIAFQGNIVYIAFAISICMKEKHDAQTIELPLRYLCGLLNQGKRLIFAGKNALCNYINLIHQGYINGAAMAMQASLKLWESSYFGGDSLLQNVACILFRPTSSLLAHRHLLQRHNVHVFAFGYDNLVR